MLNLFLKVKEGVKHIFGYPGGVVLNIFDVLYDEKGNILNPNLHDYLLMTIKDTPEIFSGIVDSWEPEGPFGAKEVGEGATLPILAAVAHAIANATGVWIKELPITPEKILNALKNKNKK